MERTVRAEKCMNDRCWWLLRLCISYSHWNTTFFTFLPFLWLFKGRWQLSSFLWLIMRIVRGVTVAVSTKNTLSFSLGFFFFFPIFVSASVICIGWDALLAKSFCFFMRVGGFCKWFFDILRLGTGEYTWLKIVQKNTVAWILRRSTSGRLPDTAWLP